MPKRTADESDERASKRVKLDDDDSGDNVVHDWDSYVPEPEIEPVRLLPRSPIAVTLGQLLTSQVLPNWFLYTSFPRELMALCNVYLGTWACTSTDLHAAITGLVTESQDDPYACPEVYLAAAMHYDLAREANPALNPSEVTSTLDRCLPLNGFRAVSWASRSFIWQPAQNFWPCLRHYLDNFCLRAVKSRYREKIPLGEASRYVAASLAATWQCHSYWESPTADLIADTWLRMQNTEYVAIDLRAGTVEYIA